MASLEDIHDKVRLRQDFTTAQSDASSVVKKDVVFYNLLHKLIRRHLPAVYPNRAAGTGGFTAATAGASKWLRRDAVHSIEMDQPVQTGLGALATLYAEGA